MRPLGLATGIALLASQALAQASFQDVTLAAGLRYQQHVPVEAPNCILGVVCELDRMSGGAAVADVDGDGDLDLFVTRMDASDLLFRNLGTGRFEDATQDAGLDGFILQSNGAAFGDIEGDGDPDLLVTVMGAPGDPRNRRNYLFVNDGAGRFQEEAVQRGADAASDSGRAAFSATFGDYDLDGDLDFHVTEWAPLGNSRLLRNRGPEAPGFFEDVTDAAGLAFGDVWGFASTFVDLDADGRPDLAVAADFGTSRLFWNQGEAGFLDGTEAARVGSDENGMGSCFGDFDADGDLDWFVTSIHDPNETCASENCNWGFTGNRLYRNEGARLFSDATDAAGVRAGFWGWGAVFFDADNDADLDLVMTNGVDFPGTDVEVAFNADPMRFWENDGSGGMTERSLGAGLADTASGKGLLHFDYDADGDVDLFLVNNAGEPRLYQNDLAPGHDWLRVRLVGSASNREGRGARVSVQARPGDAPQIREVGVAGHFLGQGETTLHFGLGEAGGVASRVEVTFPVSGRTLVRRNVRANRLLTLREPGGPCAGPGDAPAGCRGRTPR